MEETEKEMQLPAILTVIAFSALKTVIKEMAFTLTERSECHILSQKIQGHIDLRGYSGAINANLSSFRREQGLL